MRIERQLAEIVEAHEGLSRKDARRRVLEVLDAVQIPDAANRMRSYPHEFSGGMRQRIVIAMALMCKPKLILADEPTTALDVTVQSQIMQLLNEIQSETGTSILLITHDLGLVAGFCEETMVLYGGKMMESASTTTIFKKPSHPYTRGLLRAVPNMKDKQEVLTPIPGSPPNQLMALNACPFAPRCSDAKEICHNEVPNFIGKSQKRSCHVPVKDLS